MALSALIPRDLGRLAVVDGPSDRVNFPKARRSGRVVTRNCRNRERPRGLGKSSGAEPHFGKDKLTPITSTVRQGKPVRGRTRAAEPTSSAENKRSTRPATQKHPEITKHLVRYRVESPSVPRSEFDARTE